MVLSKLVFSAPSRAHLSVVGLGAIVFTLTGCPDPEARFNEFLDATEDDRPVAEEGGSETNDDGSDTSSDGLTDMTGVYLWALETSLGPDAPLQFATTVDMVVAEDGQSAVADFSFQPLTLDQGSTLDPREFIGDPLVYTGIEFDASGDFEIDMGVVNVAGAANPITGSDIEATLVILGRSVHATALCGTLEGELMSPLVFDLAGSTFGAIKLLDDGSDPETLPTVFPYRCDQVPPPDPTLPDITGTFLFALETSLGPDAPLQFATSIDFTYSETGDSGTMDLCFQPLTLDQGSTTEPRVFVGDPLCYDGIPVDSEGEFDFDMGLIQVAGAANPITGSDIEATIEMSGSIVHPDALCGTVSGELMSPLVFDLAGSSFGAVRLEDIGDDPTTLPTQFPYRCDQVPPQGG